MDARYTIRRAQLLEECQVAPEVFEQVMPRLRAFLAPFVDTLQGQAPRAHAQTYVRGLLSDVERKNVESIAYHFGHGRHDHDGGRAAGRPSRLHSDTNQACG